ncbi:MAG: hypothetical protein ABI988_07725 [Nitrospirota bacterium]
MLNEISAVSCQDRGFKSKGVFADFVGEQTGVFYLPVIVMVYRVA